MNKLCVFENVPGVNSQDMLTEVLSLVNKGEHLRALSGLLLLEELKVKDFRLVEAAIKIYLTIGASNPMSRLCLIRLPNELPK